MTEAPETEAGSFKGIILKPDTAFRFSFDERVYFSV